MNEKLLEYLSNSFLKDYLSDDNITDNIFSLLIIDMVEKNLI